jgi:hypothetical protein
VREGLSARDLERLAAAAAGDAGKRPGAKKPDRPVEVHTAAAEAT